MNDGLLVRRFQSLRNLLGDWQRFMDRNWSLRDPIGQRRAFHQFHDERLHAV